MRVGRVQSFVVNNINSIYTSNADNFEVILEPPSTAPSLLKNKNISKNTKAKKRFKDDSYRVGSDDDEYVQYKAVKKNKDRNKKSSNAESWAPKKRGRNPKNRKI